jgi:hypothetical protein
VECGRLGIALPDVSTDRPSEVRSQRGSLHDSIREGEEPFVPERREARGGGSFARRLVGAAKRAVDCARGAADPGAHRPDARVPSVQSRRRPRLRPASQVARDLSWDSIPSEKLDPGSRSLRRTSHRLGEAPPTARHGVAIVPSPERDRELSTSTTLSTEHSWLLLLPWSRPRPSEAGRACC